MKIVAVNAGPRKNWNTAMMLKKAQKGAESVGAETEYINLFELSYGRFQQGHKKEMREKQFPLDLEKAFEMGARLSKAE